MAFDPVPWFVEGGAQHSANVARLIAYLATGGSEGVLDSSSLKVAALATPGTSVRVMPGACVIKNRALGGDKESYVARMAVEDTVAIAPTGSGSGRTDLIVARVENPHISGEPWQLIDAANGPYVFPRVIQGVPTGTTNVHALNLGYSAITLARVVMPASTGTVTSAMVTDLRSVCNPVTGTIPPPTTGNGDDNNDCDPPDPVVVVPGNGDDGDNDNGEVLDATQTGYVDWPPSAGITLKIPSWATHMDIVIELINVQVRLGSLAGLIRLIIDSTVMFERSWRAERPGATVRQTVPLAYNNLPIPTAMRGKTVQWKLQAKCNSGFTVGKLISTNSTQAKYTVKFKQRAE